MTTRSSGAMRLAMAAVVALTPVVVGCMHRSPWIVLLLAPVFTLLYATGKWEAWRAAWRAGGVRAILVAVAVTLPIQLVVAGVLYLVGLGLGSLVAPGPTLPLSGADAVIALLLLVAALAPTGAIIRMEGEAAAPPVPPAPAPAIVRAAGEIELDIDPAPLTMQTFFRSPGHWRSDASWLALEGRGRTVETRPVRASEEMIAAAERRLGVRLPETLRTLYGIMDGGYVGALYVPLKDDPAPRFDDWRGAFSIDYSCLAALDALRTVAEHYADFTDDPDDLPRDAARLVVLQARYGDMTLLDYSRGPVPRVLIVDYDRAGEDPVDVAYEDFDAFFRALRRKREERRPFRREAFRSPPLASLPEAERPSAAWADDKPHPFLDSARSPGDGPEPKRSADDALVAQTEARLGVTLPPALVALWRAKNGGAIAYVHLDAPGEPDGERTIWALPIPLEHVVSLATLSGWVTFPPGERPWADGFRDPGRLIVLEASRDRAVMLDYRDGVTEPAVQAVADLTIGDSPSHLRLDGVDELFRRLRRFQRL